MPHYVPNAYPNIFRCHIFTKQISEDIRTPEIAQIRIRIIFKDHFTWIFKYLYSSLIEDIFEKGSLMLPLNKCYTGYFLIHKLYTDLFLSLKIDRQILEWGSQQKFKYIRIFKNLRMNNQIYLVVQKSTNEYPNLFILGKWHKYKYELYSRAILLEYLNIWIFMLIAASPLCQPMSAFS